jgi:hypothetical protein
MISENEKNRAFRAIVKRALIAYAAAVGIVILTLVISLARGAGWKPVLAGMPLYITVFAGIT